MSRKVLLYGDRQIQYENFYFCGYELMNFLRGGIRFAVCEELKVGNKAPYRIILDGTHELHDPIMDGFIFDYRSMVIKTKSHHEQGDTHAS